MSSYAGVYLHGAEVFTWRNEVDPTFLFLFTREEVRRTARTAEEMIDEDDNESVLLSATAGVLTDRLDVLGIGRRAINEEFDELVRQKTEVLERIRDQVPVDTEIELLNSMSLDDWTDLLMDAIGSPEKREAYRYDDPTSLRSLLDLWESADPRYLLRALLLACGPEDEVTLDVTELIAGGWIDDNFDPQGVAIEHFSYALANGSPAVIVTEGSVDSDVLKTALRLRYPHLQSFIKFFDFGDGAEGSAAAGVRTLKSFAAAGISNRVILILDNDAAARDALRALRRVKLPEHYTVLQYPELNLARTYPTLGPNGLSEMDVNGLAGSIELYLGTDALKRDDGTLSPVQWRSYLEGVGAYQGEVIDKARVQRRFRAKAIEATRNPGSMSTQDWSGLEAIICGIVEALRS